MCVMYGEQEAFFWCKFRVLGFKLLAKKDILRKKQTQILLRPNQSKEVIEIHLRKSPGRRDCNRLYVGRNPHPTQNKPNLFLLSVVLNSLNTMLKKKTNRVPAPCVVCGFSQGFQCIFFFFGKRINSFHKCSDFFLFGWLDELSNHS